MVRHARRDVPAVSHGGVDQRLDGQRAGDRRERFVTTAPVVVGERSYAEGQRAGSRWSWIASIGAIKLTTAYSLSPLRSVHQSHAAEHPARGDWGVTPTLPVPLSDVERATGWPRGGRDRPRTRYGNCGGDVPECRLQAERSAAAKMVIEGDGCARGRRPRVFAGQLRPRRRKLLTTPSSPNLPATADLCPGNRDLV